DIAESYEGIEGLVITVQGGDVRITASDDGINVAGGNDGSGIGRRGDAFAALEGALLSIQGGDITVDAGGDGLDSNGSITMSGGRVIVDGPTMAGNGALDYNGNFEMTGGFLAAAGSAGMVQGPPASSPQASIVMTFSATQAAGTKVRLADDSGQAVAEAAPA